MRRALAFASGAVLCTNLACSGDVTLRFFERAPVEEVDAGGAGSEACRELGAEVCNGADDDCNGEVDEGCERTIAWRPEPDGDFLGHPGDGVTFSEVCATGSVLSGLHVAFGKSLNQVAAVCSQVGVTVETAKGTTTFSATVGPRFTKSFVPAVNQDPTNQIADLLCPDGLVASMLEGDDDQARHILDVRIRCAPLIVNADTATIVLDLDRTQEQIVDALACSTCTAPADYAFASPVPAGQVARRIFGGVGTLVNRFGFGTTIARVAKQ